MIRTEPLKAGRSNDTLASPLASTRTPGKRARGSWVGKLPSTPPLPSPPYGCARGASHAVDQQA